MRNGPPISTPEKFGVSQDEVFKLAEKMQGGFMTNAKIKVKVFPDYCADPVWIDGANASVDELGISQVLQIALKYWGHFWEDCIADHPEKYHTDQHYIDVWKADGKKLVELLNLQNEKYEFIVAF